MLSSVSTVICGALLAGVALAQGPTTNFSSTDIQRIIGEVSLTERNSWCTAQVSACGNLCGGQTGDNNCTGATLEWTCTCASNSSQPGLQYYNPTMYSSICNKALGDCLQLRAGNQAGQDNCKTTYVCGQLNASSASGAATTSMATTSMASMTGSATGSAAPMSTSSKAMAAVVQVGQEFGSGIVGAALLAVFGLAL